MASSGDDTVQSLLSAQSEVSTVGEDSKTKGQLRTRGEGPHNDPLNCRASVSAAGSGEGGLAPGLCALPAPRTGPNPTPGRHIPLTKSARPTSRNKAEKELRHWLSINSHPKPPVFLGIGSFLHLCAPEAGVLQTPGQLTHWSVGALAPPLAQFYPIIGWQGERAERSANTRRALEEMEPEEGTWLGREEGPINWAVRLPFSKWVSLKS